MAGSRRQQQWHQQFSVGEASWIHETELHAIVSLMFKHASRRRILSHRQQMTLASRLR